MTSIERAPAPDGHEPVRVPRRDAEGRVVVDPWWGEVQPIALHPDLPTVGELEVVAHLEAGGAAVDTRRPAYVEDAARRPRRAARGDRRPPRRAAARRGHGRLLQRPAVHRHPQAVGRLLAAGHPPGMLRWYRGGVHDWVALGFPLEPPRRT